ncbi:hypothetical protein POX_f08525 [Penicillium oxalicum]|uniref:hypothetical protein n=1 Tax=Penicillium oxalicum TaxID=69781 RepID=UPI0020B6762F|nr:hypothetical protein POX_f08525 [Penicillium oxalicum]KAI2788138.1 hypothetical protein POX_f08525 [Penicillium oxalicum]
MEQIVITHAQRTPHVLAVEDGAQRLTYADLVREAHCLANSVRGSEDISFGEPFGILLGIGVKQVIAQVGIRLLGGTCVPIELSASITPQRMIEMLNRANVKRVVVDAEASPNEIFSALKLSGLRLFSLALGSGKDPHVDLSLEDLKRQEFPDRSHILFTSGSTGNPKPVQIRASGILHLARQTPITPLMREDRVAKFNNPGFDLSLFEIWVTLVAGATIVTIPRQTATDPHAFPSFLEDRGVTIIITTAALFEIIVFACPTAFHNVRHVLTAGDVANVGAMRAVLMCDNPPQHLWNTYGPTECVTLTTMHEVTGKEAQRDCIGIGRPVGDMKIFLFDGNSRIFEAGRPGEVCISGPQQCIGYLGLEQENRSRFFTIGRAGLCDNSSASNEPDGKDIESLRLYRTGDLARWRPGSDILEFVGRKDNQVKHKGFRVELGEIESTIQTLEWVRRAIVVQRPAVVRDGQKALIAFAVVDLGKGFSKKEIINLTKSRLPDYMVPDSVEFVSKLPLTNTGKVDRRQLVEESLEMSKRNIPKPSRKSQNSAQNGKDLKSQDTWTTIMNLWKDTLNITDINDEDDFFLLGGTSLLAASLIANIRRKLGHILTMEDLTGNSCLGDLVHIIQGSQQRADGWSFQNAPDHSKLWLGDIDLVNDIELVPSWNAPDEGRVFFTGATGFVGAHLLRELMLSPTVKQIACLVRAQPDITAPQRVQRTLEKYDLWPDSSEYTEKLLLLEGNLPDQFLGLGKEKFNWLSNWTSVIFHLGAKVNFCESYRDHRESNVVGTARILELAAAGRRKSLHYVSTIDVWGSTGYTLGTEAVFEDEPLLPHIQGVRFDLGYSQSQWVAESMVRRMRDRGLPVTIYRPGFVIGNPETGCSNPDDFVSRLIAGTIQMGKWPQLIQRLEYVTIDYVVKSILHISSSNSNLGRSYCLVAPNQADSVTVEDTCRVLNDAGYNIRLVDYDEWVDQVDQRPDGSLAPLLPNFKETIRGPLTRWTGSQYSPWYRADNAKEALRDRPDIVYRSLDGEMVQRSVKFWNRKGFYDLPVNA